MKTIVKYESILGNVFDSKLEAELDENSILGRIASIEDALARALLGDKVNGHYVPQRDIDLYKRSIETFKKKWEEVKKQRANLH